MYKKRFAAVCLLLALLASLSVSAYAHGCRGRGRYVSADCPVCAVEDCFAEGRHSHDGVVYCGYPHENGICDGQCRALCAVEGCDLSGRHSHGGQLCCGYGHEDGFCDGSCQAAATASAGHHGHHGHC